MKRSAFLPAIIISGVGLFLSSCSHEHQPVSTTALPIYNSYMPTGIEFNKSDIETLDKCKEWNDKLFIVNSVSELPADPIGFNESYTKINFHRFSLLLVYQLHRWSIDTYRNNFTRNNFEQSLKWTISIGSENIGDEISGDKVKLTRFAITVDKLTDTDPISVTWSITDLNFNWE